MSSPVTVIVDGIQTSRGGDVLIFLYEKEGFPKEHRKALSKISISSLQEKIEVKFENAPQVFAVKVLHDEDTNGEVTKNWTGVIPREGLGFSNNQSLGLFGPPSFNQCSVQLAKSKQPLTIRIKYP